jgi:hypothetical protein
MSFLSPSSSGSSKFEWPQEVVGFLEVRAAGVDFVDQIFNTDNTVFTQNLFDRTVVLKSNSLSLNFTVASFIDEFSDGISGGISKVTTKLPVGDVGLDPPEDIHRSFVDSDECCIVELSESEESHDPGALRVQLHNTTDSHDDCDFGCRWNIDLTLIFSQSSSVDFGSNSFIMFVIILLSFFKDFSSSGFVGCSSSFPLLLESGDNLSVSLLLFLLSFGFGGNFLLACHWWMVKFRLLLNIQLIKLPINKYSL